MTTLPGLNIQYPISQLILKREKTVETRFYALPEKYIGSEMVVIETPGRSGNFKARLVGIIKFKKCFKYQSKKEFRADFPRHKVQSGSSWDWQKDKTKWGWEFELKKVFNEPITFSKQKGIRFTREVTF